VILPEYIFNEDPKTTLVPEHFFKQALGFFNNEQYEKSLESLNRLFGTTFLNISNSGYCLFDAIILFGWNLVFLRKFSAFECWKNQVQTQYPDIIFSDEIELMSIWNLAMQGHNQEAYDRSSDLANRIHDQLPEILPDFLFIKSYSGFPLGKTQESIEDCESSFAIFRVFGKTIEAARSANFLGMLNRSISDYPEALKWYNRSMRYYSQTKLLRKQSMVHLNIGVTHYKVGDYAAAFASLNRSLEIGVEGGWTHRQCFANIALGNVYRLTRQFREARRLLHTAYGQAQELGFLREEALSLEFLGDVYRDENKPADARRFYDRAMAIARSIAPEGDIVMEIQRRVGECLLHEGDAAGAAAPLVQALEMARAQGDRYEAGVTLRVMAQVARAIGDASAAAANIERSVALLDEIGARHELAVSLLTGVEIGLEAFDRLVAAGRSDVLDTGSEHLERLWDQITRALDLLLKVDVAWWTARGRRLAEGVSGRRAAHEERLRAAAIAGERGPQTAANVIIHNSGVMRDLIQLCDLFAVSGEPVLITGETGTGKELIARRLHERGPRAAGPLVTVNVAAIPSAMFEREFFGHVRGAFSGADRDGDGFAARAHGGTLFLDEIGELPLEMQPKLLRLIQEGTFQAIGDPRERRADLRLVAATNADLARMAKEGSFRSDLLYRLKILELHLPPVRERREDVLLLLQHFLGLCSGRPADLADFFDRTTLREFQEYDWPGNVREVAMVARRAVMERQARGGVTVGHVLQGASGHLSADAGPALLELSVDDPKRERARILLALEEAGGNRLVASRRLGMSRSTLYRKMEKLGIGNRKI